jgi:hypothetical protein
MKKEKPKLIGREGRWLIFCGIPFAGFAVWIVIFETWRLEYVVGQRAVPYVLCFVPVALFVVAMMVYDRLRQKDIIPFGVGGWIFAVGLLCWYFWFGPGAAGPHHP